MNKLLSLSLIPLAATATVASIAFTPDSAQALSIGTVNIAAKTGSSFSTNFTNNGNVDDSITFTGLGNVTSSTISGITSSTDVTIADIFFNQSYTGFGDYTGTVSNPFLAFANGINFVAKNPLSIQTGSIFSQPFAAVSFIGNFVDTNNNNSLVGTGLLTGQIGKNNSYSITVESVPEPLTILGTGLALGLGGLFKSKQSKKQSLDA